MRAAGLGLRATASSSERNTPGGIGCGFSFDGWIQMADEETGRQNAVVAGASTAVTEQALLIANNELGALPDDAWGASVKGATSHVIGLRTGSQRLVMKLVTADSSGQDSERERRALQLVADYAGLPVPQLVSYGEIQTSVPVPYLIMTRLPGVRWADRRPLLTESSRSRCTRCSTTMRR